LPTIDPPSENAINFAAAISQDTALPPGRPHHSCRAETSPAAAEYKHTEQSGFPKQ
jgi:hypothetical protein